MLTKMTKMALAASLVLGAASVALAGDNVNRVHHPDLTSGKAYDLVLSRKPTPRGNGSQAYGIYRPMLCPLLEGYPDCHP
jgi:hypothetical protein